MHVQTDLLYPVFCTLLQHRSWTALLIYVKYLKMKCLILKSEHWALIFVSNWKFRLLVSLHAIDLNNGSCCRVVFSPSLVSKREGRLSRRTLARLRGVSRSKLDLQDSAPSDVIHPVSNIHEDKWSNERCYMWHFNVWELLQNREEELCHETKLWNDWGTNNYFHYWTINHFMIKKKKDLKGN